MCQPASSGSTGCGKRTAKVPSPARCQRPFPTSWSNAGFEARGSSAPRRTAAQSSPGIAATGPGQVVGIVDAEVGVRRPDLVVQPRAARAPRRHDRTRSSTRTKPSATNRSTSSSVSGPGGMPASLPAATRSSSTDSEHLARGRAEELDALRVSSRSPGSEQVMPSMPLAITAVELLADLVRVAPDHQARGSGRAAVGPSCRRRSRARRGSAVMSAYASSWVSAMQTLRCWLTVISARSRPSRSQCAASTSSLRGNLARRRREVRLVGVLRHEPQRLLLAAPPIMTGMRPTGGGWLIASFTCSACRRDSVARRAASEDDLQRLLELLEPVGERLELEAERVVLELEPAGADAELRAPAGHDVERGDDLREQRRVAVRVAGDERAEADVLGLAAPARRASCSTRACWRRDRRASAVGRSGPSAAPCRSRCGRRPPPAWPPRRTARPARRRGT